MQEKRDRILIVEDDKADVMAFERFARSVQLPYDYVFAMSVREASYILESQVFDAVVTDFFLGDGIAFDLFHKIKDAPIIIVTGTSDKEIAVQAMKTGAYDYLFKDPLGDYLKVLPATVQNAIAHKRAEDELKKYREHLEELVEERTAELQAEIRERERVEKELEEANGFLQNILESSSSISIVSTDLKDNILYWNIGSENMFGYKAEEVVGSEKINILYNFIEKTREKIQKIKKSFISGNRNGMSCEVEEVTRDGRKLWINMALTPRFDENGQLIGILGIGEDITDRKEIDQMRSEFISIVSHELRTPLTSILTALNLVSGGETGELPEQAKRMVDIAHRNSERLRGLINDILDSEKIEAGKAEFHLQPLELTPLVKQAIEDNHVYAQQLGVEFVLENAMPGIRVNADSSRLMQVFTNLLSNAAKFSPPNDVVVISVSRHDEAVRVAVTDHGPGVPQDFQKHIFQKFSQAQSLGARKKGGSGLGLSISKAIVEKMGGQIGFETEIDVGTTFYFDLPEYHPLPVRF